MCRCVLKGETEATQKIGIGGDKCVATRQKVFEQEVEHALPPAVGLEAREDQMISLAVGQAEEMLRNKKAPTAIVVHYLKLATTRNQLEKEKLRKENLLLEARANAIESAARSEEMYAKAIEAMRVYSGSLNRSFDE